MDTALAIAAQMPDVVTLDIGGGYKVGRMPGEQQASMKAIMDVFGQKLNAFAEQTGRQLHLEIEPGAWLVAHAGTLLAEIVDIVDTGAEGFTFLRTNTGMNDFLRPTLHGAQHTLRVLNSAKKQVPYVVVGHNCESSDILTTAPGDPETIQPRELNESSIGDLLAIEDTGAYCASLRATGYNAYPAAREVLIEDTL
jgi:diaminopimelate decarboxylase